MWIPVFTKTTVLNILGKRGQKRFVRTETEIWEAQVSLQSPEMLGKLRTQ